jgi:pimeloyl-ACP methyl ester carboxylesterase
MAWAALPTVFGEEFLRQHQKTLKMIVNAVVKRNNSRALIAQLDAILQYPPQDSVPKDFSRPTLIITGSQDPLVSGKDVERLADLCDAQHVELSGVGHSIPAEAPRMFEKVVLNFLTPTRQAGKCLK